MCAKSSAAPTPDVSVQEPREVAELEAQLGAIPAESRDWRTIGGMKVRRGGPSGRFFVTMQYVGPRRWPLENHFDAAAKAARYIAEAPR